MNIENPAVLNEVMVSILDGLCACLDENSPAGAPPSCFVSLTRPPDDCCDYLAVYFQRMQPTQNFPEVSNGRDECGTTQRMVRLQAKLRRSCWPVVKDSAVSPFPPASEIQSASEGLLVDLNVVWCCLNDQLLSGDWTLDAGDCLTGKLLEIVPDPPLGGCAGFTATFLVELESCC